MTSAAWTETPLFIDAPDGTLFGVLTQPVHAAPRSTVIHLRAGGQGPTSGRNRTTARLCRRLAEVGFESLRFDYHGVGDSAGQVARFRHDEPFVRDLTACLARLTQNGSSSFILIGDCFGARTALAIRERRIEAMVLLALHVRDAEKVGGVTRPLVRHRSMLGYARRAVSLRMLKLLMTKRHRYLNAVRGVLQAPAAAMSTDSVEPPWVSRAAIEGFRSAVARGTKILLVNGTKDPGFEDFNRASAGTLGGILRSGKGLVEIETLDGRVGAWTDVAIQAATIDLIAEWLEVAVPRSEGRTIR